MAKGEAEDVGRAENKPDAIVFTGIRETDVAPLEPRVAEAERVGRERGRLRAPYRLS